MKPSSNLFPLHVRPNTVSAKVADRDIVKDFKMKSIKLMLVGGLAMIFAGVCGLAYLGWLVGDAGTPVCPIVGQCQVPGPR